MQAATQSAPAFALDPRVGADLRLQLKNDPQGGLKQAARQFEALLLQTMLKSMRDATPQDGLMNSDQTRFFTSMLDQQLAHDLAGRGQLGFARLIEQQLGRNAGGAASSLEQVRKDWMQGQAASSAAGLPGAARNRGTSGAVLPPTGAPVGEAAGSNGDFVNRVWPHAVEAANSLGVPPHFLVAHAALESGWGKSEIRTAGGAPSYNLFGVKAGRNWNGPSVEVQTTEYENGVAVSTREKFRVYGSYAEAFRDYAGLLRGNARFSAVVGQQDGTQFARSLQQGGYATDPLYADKLGRIIGGSTLRQALAG